MAGFAPPIAARDRRRPSDEPLPAARESTAAVPERPAATALHSAIGDRSVPAYAAARADCVQRAAAPANRTGLPDALKSGIEAMSAYSLDGVRVHRNSSRPRALEAHAFTQGTDIHLAPGEERHLPHEAWHVVQQMQGRVRPTMSLGSTAVNDDAGLEAEADRMGARAFATAAPPRRAPLREPRAIRGAEAPVQGVFIVRNGEVVWENDPYVLQSGESLWTDPFRQEPVVLLDQGKTEVRFDSQGKMITAKRNRPIPTHETMQDEREAQGQQMRKRLKIDPANIKKETAKLASLTSNLESAAGDSVPKKHDQKIKRIFKKGEVTGDQFRRVHKGKDELTQSQASTSYIRGLRKKGGDTPPHYSQQLDDFAETSLRLMSSLRAPTQAVVAPVTHNNSQRGQQHPTTDSEPVLDEGASSHAYSDRARVQSQVETFNTAIKDPNAPPSAIFLASTLSAAVSTLSTMSAPTSAGNLPDFNPTGQQRQTRDHERIKDQTNILASAIAVPTNTGVQDYDANWTSQETPTSPRRNDMAAAKIATTLTPPAKQPVQQVTNFVDAVQDTALQLIAAMPGPQADLDDPNRQAFRTYMQQVHDFAGQLDQTDPANVQILGNVFGHLHQALLNFRNLIRRRTFVPAAMQDPLSVHGERLGALEQFFSECGQMAAHNAMALAAHADPASVAGRQEIADEATLDLRGDFRNNIGEDEVRAMTAQRPDIPVVGNLQQLGGVMTMLQQGNIPGLVAHQIGIQEIQGATAVNNFVTGATHRLVIVVNTVTHKDPSASGHHWISVLVTRRQDGQLAIQFLDSLRAPADYSQLFQGLRQFLGHIPPQQHAPPQPPPGNGASA